MPHDMDMLYLRIGNSQFKSAITKYLAVQVHVIIRFPGPPIYSYKPFFLIKNNAVLSHENNSNNMCGFGWTSSPPSTFNFEGQVAALRVLVPPISLPGTSEVTPSSTWKMPVEATAGGVRGGVLALAALTISFLLVRRYCKSRPA
ncbi:hypothetical protein V5O48_008074 [Marasmius crinis-equi]|uniref:Uncharacterized protein n=1 Tax=Marasmius crinis-equi TaxID=585013 RepID=A0ABR3FEW1_9AGAR